MLLSNQKNSIFSVSAGANATHDVVYQDEEGQWVTDLAYYSSFQKEADKKTLEDAAQLQSEEFVPPSVYPQITVLKHLIVVV